MEKRILSQTLTLFAPVMRKKHCSECLHYIQMYLLKYVCIFINRYTLCKKVNAVSERKPFDNNAVLFHSYKFI
jgi:hypothetical protein